MKYKIFAALNEDVNSGWIRIGTQKILQRTIVYIINKQAKKKIYCEVLTLDKNFLELYNNPPRVEITDPVYSAVINEWYRKRLGDIETKTEYELEIKEVDNLFGRLRASLQHPQAVIRIAANLGIVSVILGFIGLILGIISLFNKQCLNYLLGI